MTTLTQSTPPDSDLLLSQARELWLSSNADMEEVERLYRSVLSEDGSTLLNQCDSEDGQLSAIALSQQQEQQQVAREKLSLILCQSGRSKEASAILSSLGYICRLANHVLDYPIGTEEAVSLSPEPSTSRESKAPCQILDNFLFTAELQMLQDVFLSKESSYWTFHEYQVEPPSPYVSYLIPLQTIESFGFIGHIVNKCWDQLKSKFPLLTKATCVEMWAHNRPHASGHQMHFDSDNEGLGGVRNPIISTILYLTEGTGGPSLITNQKLAHGQLATKGWLVHAKEKRLVAFDGQVLHGVIPVRDVSQGAAQVFPMDTDWAKRLRREFARNVHEDSREAIPVEPLEIKPIYETLCGEAWTRGMGFPDYDQVFQGF